MILNVSNVTIKCWSAAMCIMWPRVQSLLSIIGKPVPLKENLDVASRMSWYAAPYCDVAVFAAFKAVQSSESRLLQQWPELERLCTFAIKTALAKGTSDRSGNKSARPVYRIRMGVFHSGFTDAVTGTINSSRRR
jgi:hypothetical protein